MMSLMEKPSIPQKVVKNVDAKLASSGKVIGIPVTGVVLSVGRFANVRRSNFI
jgi:hypothetical protein